jgi:hypothetical protein
MTTPTNSIAERIREHAKMRDKRDLSIPEWGVTCTVYPLTVNDRNTQLKTMQTDPYFAFVEVIATSCRDENGKRIFGPSEKLAMKMEGDPAVIERVALFILEPYLQGEKAGE